ncbi:glutamate-cysteine ligase family protein [Rhodococcoides corynebacterioides]|uniref:glutamate-cysteine ligase family protein n=1 Tax=Rhodococcoides corynebacterioides TaxID=53972 RepID=UPI000837A2C4|nr:glutamate-cysteine ligase family protein [Rhodococcus corynebacterioides]MBY6351277.1 glutamate--cysteine ligase [Rhodococcus corynebacterioides]MBY6364972.1 glutamate--cysteine ligase [Rhodococcus corynebacterioides]
MGDEVEQRTFSRQDRQDFRRKVQQCLDALASMLADDTFAVDEPRIGMEIELNLVDDAMDPAMANTAVLEAIADPDFQTELGRFNIEINVAPAPLAGDRMRTLETELRASLDHADARAKGTGSALAMIGMLPTLREEHFAARWLSENPRYDLLNRQIFAARGEDIELNVTGVPLPGSREAESLHRIVDTILPEAACTSVQLHLQVSPDEFPAHWNAAQALAGVQVALAANSPFLAGRALWHETRLPLFEQATDTRPQELKNQGVRPRVWFGERWITSIFDLFEENSRYFPALLPVVSDQDPMAELAAGRTPELTELKMHNGTVYRWNRPIYDTSGGEHHLRLENRVLPAGPSVIDVMADAAFYYGALRSLVDADRPVWSQMSFDAAQDNLHSAARSGIDARCYWPEVGWVSPQELVLRRLLPMAEAGLDAFGVDPDVRDRYLRVIEGRCLRRQNGAVWQRSALAARERAGDDRDRALAGMLADYLERMHDGEPVHTWSW